MISRFVDLFVLRTHWYMEATSTGGRKAQPDLVREWEESTQTYVIKFGLPIGKYEAPNEQELVGNLILRAAYDYIFNGEPIEDVYSFLPPHMRVEPQEIIDVYTAEEYKTMISN